MKLSDKRSYVKNKSGGGFALPDLQNNIERRPGKRQRHPAFLHYSAISATGLFSA